MLSHQLPPIHSVTAPLSLPFFRRYKPHHHHLYYGSDMSSKRKVVDIGPSGSPFDVLSGDAAVKKGNGFAGVSPISFSGTTSRKFMEEELLSKNLGDRENLLISGLYRDEYSQDMLKESRCVVGNLFDRIADLEKRLSEQDVVVRALRSGLAKRHDELLQRDLENGDLLKKVDGLVNQVIPYVCETLATGPEVVRLVDLAVNTSKEKGVLSVTHSEYDPGYVKVKESFDQAIRDLAAYKSNFIYDVTHLSDPDVSDFLSVKPRLE